MAGATRCSKGERRESEPEINIELNAIPCKYKITAAKVDFKNTIFLVCLLHEFPFQLRLKSTSRSVQFKLV